MKRKIRKIFNVLLSLVILFSSAPIQSVGALNLISTNEQEINETEEQTSDEIESKPETKVEGKALRYIDQDPYYAIIMANGDPGSAYETVKHFNVDLSGGVYVTQNPSSRFYCVEDYSGKKYESIAPSVGTKFLYRTENTNVIKWWTSKGGYTAGGWTNNANQGIALYNVDVTGTTPYIRLPKVAKTGYTFKGWEVTWTVGSWNHYMGSYKQFNGTNKGVQFGSDGFYYVNVGAYSTVRTVKPIFERSSYSYTFSGEEGSSNYPGPHTKTPGVDFTFPTSPTPQYYGHKFLGWAANIWEQDGRRLPETGYYKPGQTVFGLPDCNVLWWSQWEPWKHTVKYDLRGGSGSFSNQTKTYGQSMWLHGGKPTRTGYTFTGWDTKADGSGTDYAPGAQYMPDQDGGTVTLYAQWKGNNYTVDLNGTLDGKRIWGLDGIATVDIYINGKLVANDVSDYGGKHAYGSTYKLTDIKVNSKYKCTRGDITGTIKGDVDLNTIFVTNQYNLTVDPNGGTWNGSSSSQSMKVTVGDTKTISRPTRTGYTFAGWSNSSNFTGSLFVNGQARDSGTGRGTFSQKGYEDHTNYKWSNITNNSANNWNSISFGYYNVSAGDKVRITGKIKVNSLPSGMALNLYHGAKHNDYENSKLSLGNTGGVYKDFSIERTFTSATSTAVFEIYTSNISGKSGNIDFDLKNIKIENLTKGTYVQDSVTMPSSDVRLTAKWEPITYTVNYDANGGNGTTPSSVHTYDIEKELTANGFSRIGYTFKGWNTKANGEGDNYINKQKVKNLTSIDGESITLYAKWSINSYTAIFDSNGGTAANPKTITKNYGAELGSLPTTTKKGYTFLGWYTAKNGGTKIDETTKMPANNVTYYAHWENNPPEITAPILPEDVPEVPSNIPPFIDSKMVIVQKGDPINPIDYVRAMDKEDGDISDRVVIEDNPIPYDKKGNTTTTGTYEVLVSVTDDGGEKVTEIVTILVNNSPELEAKDRYFFIGDVVNADEILNKVTSNDFEDGELKDKVIIQSITNLDNEPLDTQSIDTSIAGEYIVKYKVTDQYKASTEVEAKFTVTEHSVIPDSALYNIRFISQDYIDTLNPNSNWKKEADLFNYLQTSLNKEATDNNAIYVFEFDAQKSNQMKEWLISNDQNNDDINSNFLNQFSDIFVKRPTDGNNKKRGI